MIDPTLEKKIERVREAHDYVKPPKEDLQACPARTIAVLGFKVPTEIPCGKLKGHRGVHHYEITWSD